MVGSVEIEIMGTAAYFRAFITYVRGLFQLSTESWSKVWTIQRTALRTTFPAKGITCLIATNMLFFTIRIMFTFGAFSLSLILKMRNAKEMPADFFGYGRRILVDPVGDLSKIFTTADTMFNSNTISKGKVFFISGS